MSADVGDPPVMAPPDDLWSPAHDELRRKVRAWLAEHVLPEVEAWEARAAMPREVFPAAAQAGLFGWKVPVERGGLGVDLLADAVVSEELAGCWSGGVAAALGAHKDLGPYYVWRFGTDEQRDRWMPGFLAGTSIGALAVTEPGAGSDVAGLRTVAMRDGEDYVLRGEKTFITNGHWADVVVVAALTDPDRGGHQGLSLFVVERDDPGFSSARID
ncbi:MAG TPA: acyl-CoA dehydrogenase family protein, partial [Egibacteraceae bacterium]|nr:acyl-CoA dehydrogenase family protein [Egibacteraceae bacterium]